MSHRITFPKTFRFVEFVAMARRGHFDPDWFREPVELDFSTLTFAGVCAMSCIKALIRHYGREWPEESCASVDHQQQDCIRYLQRMDFFTAEIPWCFPLGHEAFVRHAPEGRFVPIKNLHHQAETPQASREIVDCLDLADEPSRLTGRYALSELIDNALQHSGSRTGAYVSAQTYPKNDLFNAGIVDTGMGIREHLKHHPLYRDLNDDCEALRIALKPNVTGVYMPDTLDARLARESENQGIGLSVTDEIAKRGKGVLYLWSGRALYRSNAGVETMPVAWPGTAVFLCLPRHLKVDHMGIIREIPNPLRRHKTRLHFG